MAQQWYLDIDGVKSGPYQSPEVLSLLAEGEILPHHRIAPHLKEGPWTSVLEWRLQQAKLIPTPATPPPPLESPPLATPSSATPAASTPSATPAVTPTPATPAPSPYQNMPREQHIQPYTPKELNSAPKRDPMAEMFDIIQNNKQKREAKSIKSAQEQQERTTATHSPVLTGNKNNFLTNNWKTIFIGAGIIFVGFTLGQWFQKNSLPQTPTSPVIANAPVPTGASAPTKTVDTESVHATDTEMVDRSTDKMTIRGKVLKHSDVPQPSKVEGKMNDTKDANAKDIRELQDLKKELMELKNLKEELKNSIEEDDSGDTAEAPDQAGDTSYPHYNPDMVPNPVNPGNPNYPNYPYTNGQPGQPNGAAKPLNNPDIHY